MGTTNPKPSLSSNLEGVNVASMNTLTSQAREKDDFSDASSDGVLEVWGAEPKVAPAAAAAATASRVNTHHAAAISSSKQGAAPANGATQCQQEQEASKVQVSSSSNNNSNNNSNDGTLVCSGLEEAAKPEPTLKISRAQKQFASREASPPLRFPYKPPSPNPLPLTIPDDSDDGHTYTISPQCGVSDKSRGGSVSSNGSLKPPSPKPSLLLKPIPQAATVTLKPPPKYDTEPEKKEIQPKEAPISSPHFAVFNKNRGKSFSSSVSLKHSSPQTSLLLKPPPQASLLKPPRQPTTQTSLLKPTPQTSLLNPTPQASLLKPPRQPTPQTSLLKPTPQPPLLNPPGQAPTVTLKPPPKYDTEPETKEVQPREVPGHGGNNHTILSPQFVVGSKSRGKSFSSSGSLKPSSPQVSLLLKPPPQTSLLKPPRQAPLGTLNLPPKYDTEPETKEVQPKEDPGPEQQRRANGRAHKAPVKFADVQFESLKPPKKHSTKSRVEQVSEWVLPEGTLNKADAIRELMAQGKERTVWYGNGNDSVSPLQKKRRKRGRRKGSGKRPKIAPPTEEDIPEDNWHGRVFFATDIEFDARYMQWDNTPSGSMNMLIQRSMVHGDPKANQEDFLERIPDTLSLSDASSRVGIDFQARIPDCRTYRDKRGDDYLPRCVVVLGWSLSSLGLDAIFTYNFLFLKWFTVIRHCGTLSSPTRQSVEGKTSKAFCHWTWSL
jgi:hypothetical protein